MSDKPKRTLKEVLDSFQTLELMNEMKALKDKYDSDADDFWNNLSYEDKLKAFYSVCKRIHKGDIEERGSYRYVLYQVFGFEFDAYVVGMNCGYLDIHNSIYSNEDIEKMRKEGTDGSGKIE